MPPATRFLIGLVAVIGLGAIYHGPAGAGERFAGQMEAQANAAVAPTGVPGIEVSLHRSPLSRVAIVSGEADRFQREGMGSLPGIKELVGRVDGISAVRWADEPERSGIPLVVETLLMLVAAYLVGLGFGWLLFGRRKRQSYLD